MAAWEAALEVPAWDRAPVCVHGDLLPGNLRPGWPASTWVIDWGSSCVRRPRLRFEPAWTLFRARAVRPTNRRSGSTTPLGAGRGWALTES